MKKLIILALASTTGLSAMAITMAGCGNTSPVAVDTSTMTEGNNNQTGLGGYWFTFVDRTLKSTVLPNTGKVEPLNSSATELNAGIAEGVGMGVETDPTNGANKAIHVTGKVISVPSPVAADPYMDVFYSTLVCGGTSCGNQIYPAAGLGCGFKANNALLGADSAGKVGIGFRMMLGATHGKDATGALNPVAIALPMDLTDVPDPSFGDLFGSKYAPDTVPESGVPADPNTNTPLCTFANTLKADKSPVGNAKTCYANLATLIPTPASTGAWVKYCVTFDNFVAPSWAKAGLDAVGVTKIFPERLIKIQFDAFKPKDGNDGPFDLWVDDVKLLDAATQASYCADANPIIAAAVP
jgi:hypothetical protein